MKTEKKAKQKRRNRDFLALCLPISVCLFVGDWDCRWMHWMDPSCHPSQPLSIFPSTTLNASNYLHRLSVNVSNFEKLTAEKPKTKKQTIKEKRERKARFLKSKP